MPTHSGPNSGPDPGHEPEKRQANASSGYERSDANVAGIVVFLTAMVVFIAVIGLLCYGIGKVVNARMNKVDGPNSKWTKTVDVRQLGNMPSSPELQNKVAELMQSFPTPWVQTDNGDQDIAGLHARENLLLDNYSWVNQSQGKVRIPIERAMELMAQRGLPVAPAVETAPPMTGDNVPAVTMPLTGGFAPTAFEQEEAKAKAVKAQRGEQK